MTALSTDARVVVQPPPPPLDHDAKNDGDDGGGGGGGDTLHPARRLDSLSATANAPHTALPPPCAPHDPTLAHSHYVHAMQYHNRYTPGQMPLQYDGHDDGASTSYYAPHHHNLHDHSAMLHYAQLNNQHPHAIHNPLFHHPHPSPHAVATGQFAYHSQHPLDHQHLLHDSEDHNYYAPNDPHAFFEVPMSADPYAYTDFIEHPSAVAYSSQPYLFAHCPPPPSHVPNFYLDSASAQHPTPHYMQEHYMHHEAMYSHVATPPPPPPLPLLPPAVSHLSSDTTAWSAASKLRYRKPPSPRVKPSQVHPTEALPPCTASLIDDPDFAHDAESLEHSFAAKIRILSRSPAASISSSQSTSTTPAHKKSESNHSTAAADALKYGPSSVIKTHDLSGISFSDPKSKKCKKNSVTKALSSPNAIIISALVNEKVDHVDQNDNSASVKAKTNVNFADCNGYSDRFHYGDNCNDNDVDTASKSDGDCVNDDVAYGEINVENLGRLPCLLKSKAPVSETSKISFAPSNSLDKIQDTQSQNFSSLQQQQQHRSRYKFVDHCSNSQSVADTEDGNISDQLTGWSTVPSKLSYRNAATLAFAPYEVPTRHKQQPSVPPSSSIATAATGKESYVWRTPNSKNSESKPKTVFCHYYNKYGRCMRGEACKFVHDNARVLLCTLMLRNIEHDKEKCLHNHTLTHNNTPACIFYLRGLCKKGSSCVFAHQDVDPEKGLCEEFKNSGFCSSGAQCRRLHQLLAKRDPGNEGVSVAAVQPELKKNASSYYSILSAASSAQTNNTQSSPAETGVNELHGVIKTEEIDEDPTSNPFLVPKPTGFIDLEVSDLDHKKFNRMFRHSRETKTLVAGSLKSEDTLLSLKWEKEKADFSNEKVTAQSVLVDHERAQSLNPLTESNVSQEGGSHNFNRAKLEDAVNYSCQNEIYSAIEADSESDSNAQYFTIEPRASKEDNIFSSFVKDMDAQSFVANNRKAGASPTDQKDFENFISKN